MNILKSISEKNRVRLLLLIVGIWGVLSQLVGSEFSLIDKWYSLFISSIFILSAILGFFTFTGDASLSKGEALLCFLVLIGSIVRLVLVATFLDDDQYSLKIVLVPLAFMLITLAMLIIEWIAIKKSE